VKKIISYSLYGDNPKYINGLKYNLNLLDKVFSNPSWIMRVYYNNSVDIKNFISHERVEYINVGEDNNYMFWRFYVWDDPEVEIYLCRDIDDRLNFWDYNMVCEWEKTSHNFTVARCHLQHNVDILGGLWGGKPRNFSFKMKDLISEFSNRHDTTRYNDDQIFLSECVWPLVRQETLSFGFYFGHDCAGHVNLPLDYHGLEKQTPIGNARDVEGRLMITDHNITEMGGAYESHHKDWESKCSFVNGFHSKKSDSIYNSLKNDLSTIKTVDQSDPVFTGIDVSLLSGNKFLFTQ
jgi:hypothetical protein